MAVGQVHGEVEGAVDGEHAAREEGGALTRSGLHRRHVLHAGVEGDVDLGGEQARLAAWADREKALRTVEKTSALIRVGAGASDGIFVDL